MATDIERLVVSLEANIKKFEREMARSRGVTDAAMRDVERSVGASATKVESAMGRMGAAIKGGIASALAGISVRELKDFADSNTRITNALKVSGLEGDKLASVYESLFQAAQKQGAPFEALATLYSRAAMSQKELNVTSAELVKFTTGVATALRVQGTSAQEASGALLQLGQLLGSGKVQAEEFNSVQEGALPILQTVANGLLEAGGSVNKLKELVKEGKVSSEAFFRAFEAGQPSLDEMASKSAPTFAQGVQKIQNAMTKWVGEVDRLVSASEKVANAVDSIVASLGTVPEVFKTTLQEIRAIIAIYDKLAATIRTAAGATAIFNQGPLPSEPGDPEPLKFRVKPKSGPSSTAGDGGAPAVVKQVSLKSFKVPGAKDKKDGGDGADKLNDYEKEVKAIEKRTRAFDSERDMVGRTALEVAKAEASFKLLEAAQKAGIPVTDTLRGKIDTLASAYGAAKVALDDAEERQRKFENMSRQTGATLSDSFKDAILNGEKLVNVLDKLLKSLASRGFDSIFDSLFSKDGAGTNLLKGAGGGLGGLLSGIVGKADGGSISGPGTGTSDSILARLSNGEYVVNAKSARRFGPLLEAINKGGIPGFARGGLVGAPTAEVGTEAFFQGEMRCLRCA